MSVCPWGGRCISPLDKHLPLWADFCPGRHPPMGRHPSRQTPPRHTPPWADPPGWHPPRQTPPFVIYLLMCMYSQLSTGPQDVVFIFSEVLICINKKKYFQGLQNKKSLCCSTQTTIWVVTMNIRLLWTIFWIKVLVVWVTNVNESWKEIAHLSVKIWD